MNMSTAMTQSLEKICVFLAVLIILLATTGFVLAPNLDQIFAPRFIFSAVVLGLTALYLRLKSSKHLPLHRAAYRVALTMMLWSLGLFFAPFPNVFLYLITIPALFFLYRLEVKGDKALPEDEAAAGVLLAFGAFLYFQQQPLAVVLFPDRIFDWQSYYFNAPVMIIIGLGFMRLNRHTTWQGLSLLGTAMLFFGLVLTGSLLLGDRLPGYGNLLMIAVVGHALLAVTQLEGPFGQGLASYTGLSETHQKTYGLYIYILTNVTLQIAMIWLLYRSYEEGNWLGPALAPIALAGPVYAYHRFGAPLLVIELGLLGLYTLWGPFPEIPAELLIILPALLLVVPIIQRRLPALKPYIGNHHFQVLLVIYFASAAVLPLLNPVGALVLLYPFICWFFLPSRPLAVPRNYHFLLLLPLTGIPVLCFGGGWSASLWIWWAAAIMGCAVLLISTLHTRRLHDLSVTWQWLIIRDWRVAAPRGLFVLAATAVVFCGLGFLFDHGSFVTGWISVAVVSGVLAAATSCFLAYTIMWKTTWLALATEICALLFLGLLRWKTAVYELLPGDRIIDGYMLLVLACVVAGIREAARRQIPRFEPYFRMTMQVYALAGMVIAFWVDSGRESNFHGEICAAVLAGIYGWIAGTRSRFYLIPAFLFGNLALILFFMDENLSNSMFYVMPVLSSVLVLSQMFKEGLGSQRLKVLRMCCALIMLGLSAWYNLSSFHLSIWYPVTAALVAGAGIVLGISLRIRVYLYTGTLFFVINALGALIHVIRNQPPEATKLAVGAVFLVIGVLFTGGFLFFQMKRQAILDHYRQLREQLNQWE